ncbi:unnamed protein product [Orchesella dallaii]|uniref:O-acyltransferase WSD1-like N-terminal domain-containing protein n=1 Tax=Orchesella dallaii TaxID=48710 RepID=A0ABP1QRB1_9HEXA
MGYLEPTGLFQFLISLTIYILLGPTFLFVLIINELARLFVSLCLRVNYGGNISLIHYGTEAIWAVNRPNRPRITTGIFKLHKLLPLERVKQTLNDVVFPAKSSNGDQVYLKLKNTLVVKYGYACWRKSGKEFDLDEHVRCLPDNKVYNKAEMKDLINTWAEDMSEERPQWEFIIVPRFVDNADESETCLLVFRQHHAYMDGLCGSRMFEKFFTSGYTWYINPYEFRIPFWKQFLFYLNAVIFGAYATILLAITKTKKFWTELPSNGSPPRAYAWTKRIDVEVVRSIKENLNNPPLTSLIVNAYVAAAKEILPAGRVPDLLRVMEISAFLPYPNDRLQNRFTSYYYGINSMQPDFERINATKKESWKAMTGPWIPTTYSLIRLFGRFPVCFHFIVVTGGPTSLMMNNLPLSRTKFSMLDSCDALEVFIFNANPSDTGMQLLCFSYDNSIKIMGSARPEYLTGKELEDIFERIPEIIDEWAHKLVDGEMEAV